MPIISFAKWLCNFLYLCSNTLEFIVLFCNGVCKYSPVLYFSCRLLPPCLQPLILLLLSSLLRSSSKLYLCWQYCVRLLHTLAHIQILRGQCGYILIILNSSHLYTYPISHFISRYFPILSSSPSLIASPMSPTPIPQKVHPISPNANLSLLLFHRSSKQHAAYRCTSSSTFSISYNLKSNSSCSPPSWL